MDRDEQEMSVRLRSVSLTVFSVAVFLAACAPLNAADSALESAPGAQSNETVCKRISEERKRDYTALSGEVVAAGWRTDGGDDFTGKQPSHFSFEAKLARISDDHVQPSDTFLVWTPFVSRDPYVGPPDPPMVVGKRYQFCAADFDSAVAARMGIKSGEVYDLNVPETIREIQE